MTIQRERGEWFKSSYSPDKDDCVEVRLGVGVDVRDSKAPEAGQIAFSGGSWRALLDAVGER